MTLIKSLEEVVIHGSADWENAIMARLILLVSAKTCRSAFFRVYYRVLNKECIGQQPRTEYFLI